MEALDAFQCDPHQRVLDVAARLESASVGVDVDVAHRSLDADAAVRGAPGVGVQHVHKLGVFFGQSVLVVCVLEGGAGRIQTWRKKKKFLCCCAQISAKNECENVVKRHIEAEVNAS